MPRSAVFRITLAFAAAFALATAILGLAVYEVAHGALKGQLDDRISAEMSFLISEYREEGELALHAVIRNRELARRSNRLRYGLLAADGRPVAGNLPIAHADAGWQTLSYVDRPGDVDTARAYAVDIAPGRRLIVAADSDALSEVDHLILGLLAVAMTAMLGIGTIGALMLTGHLRRRLAVIAAGAEAIMAGELGRRIPIGSRPDEFDRLGIVLNAMLDRITMLLTNLQQVSADIAHDLRQPLARLRAQLEQALDAAAPAAAIETAIDQADHVLALFTSILRISEIEAGRLRTGFAEVDLAALASEIGESYAPAIEDNGRRFSVHVQATPAISGDRELLAQALVNLLDNAQLHTPPGSRIRLSVEVFPDRIWLSVADNGPGVAKADRGRIIERFTRLEASRNQPGHGLGLALVAAVAQIHGVRLRFGDNRPGLVATLEFAR